MKVQSQVEVLAPPEEVFGILADQTQRAEFMSNLETWEHVGGPKEGEGAQYRLVMRVGPVALAAVVQIVDWEPPRVFSWASLKGLRTWGRFTVRPSAKGSVVTLRIGYASSENLIGVITDRVAAPFVGREVTRTLQGLAERVVSSLSEKVRGTARRARAEAAETAAALAKSAPKEKREPLPGTTRGSGGGAAKGLPRQSRVPVRRGPRPA